MVVPETHTVLFVFFSSRENPKVRKAILLSAECTKRHPSQQKRQKDPIRLQSPPAVYTTNQCQVRYIPVSR